MPSSLPSSAVSLYPTAVANELPTDVGISGSPFFRRLKINTGGSGYGTATDVISATALGFSTLISASSLWDATNSKGYPAVVDPVNNQLYLLDGSAAPAPVAVTTAAGYITVLGLPFVKPTAPV